MLCRYILYEDFGFSNEVFVQLILPGLLLTTEFCCVAYALENLDVSRRFSN